MKRFLAKAVEKVGGGGSSSSSSAASHPLLNKVVQVGQFHVRVESVLGEGGFATIYRAKDINTGTLFALKHTRLGADAEAAKEVQQEAKIMAKVKGHPNVLRLHALAFAGPPGAETDGYMVRDPAVTSGRAAAPGSGDHWGCVLGAMGQQGSSGWVGGMA